MNTYKFTVKIDATSFKGNRVVYGQGKYYEDAEESVFDKLREEFRNEVAFFNIVDFRRV